MYTSCEIVNLVLMYYKEKSVLDESFGSNRCPYANVNTLLQSRKAFIFFSLSVLFDPRVKCMFKYIINIFE